MHDENSRHVSDDHGTSSSKEPREKPFANRVRRALKKDTSQSDTIHPGLIPGISVEDTNTRFPTNKWVFLVALFFTVAVLIWAIITPDNINEVGTTLQSWVVANFGWFLGTLVVVATIFMFVIGYGPTGRIRLGADGSTPDYSTASWISMLFAAGLGIGLLFYGSMEPLSHFLEAAPATDAESGTMDAVLPALSQAILHQASFAWGVYSLVGGALAYSAYRRGRLPLISAIFEPVFPDGSHRFLGKVIDIFAVLVTLFGTATSLGIGALQIRTGTSIITGRDITGNIFVAITISVLTAIFVISAVSGIKRGIRWLSNINMILVIVLGLFVLIAGPTIFLLDLLPTSILTFLDTLPEMLSVRASEGDAEHEFLTTWTMLFWSWWISWSPFVGMFIAKISQGRTLRQFVTVVVFAPALISVAWYVVMGGSAIWMNSEGMDVTVEDSGENVTFDVLGNLPWSSVLWIVVLVAVVIFFITAADSATNVMGSMSQSGRPIASLPVTVIWGTSLGLISLFLLLAGGENALSGLQSIMVSCAVPFAVVLVGIMVAWSKDLYNDPSMIRRRYARVAIVQGVHRGIDEHGDDFVFGAARVPADQGAGAGFESDDPALTEWFTEHANSQPDSAETTDGSDSAETDPKQ